MGEAVDLVEVQGVSPDQLDTDRPPPLLLLLLLLLLYVLLVASSGFFSPASRPLLLQLIKTGQLGL